VSLGYVRRYGHLRHGGLHIWFEQPYLSITLGAFGYEQRSYFFGMVVLSVNKRLIYADLG
jgi:hypothetical protein